MGRGVEKVKEVDYVKEFHFIPRAMGSTGEFKEAVRFVLLEDHLSCCGESHSGEVYQRWGDKLGDYCKNPGEREI